jgi:hypothetical protein
LPQAKAHALGKAGRASAAQKKRREDPNPERRGPAHTVATKVKEGSSAITDEDVTDLIHDIAVNLIFNKQRMSINETDPTIVAKEVHKAYKMEGIPFTQTDLDRVLSLFPKVMKRLKKGFRDEGDMYKEEQLDEGFMDSIKNQAKNFRMHLRNIFGGPRGIDLGQAQLICLDSIDKVSKQLLSAAKSQSSLYKKLDRVFEPYKDRVRKSRTVQEAHAVANQFMDDYPDLVQQTIDADLLQSHPEIYHQQQIKKFNAGNKMLYPDQPGQDQQVKEARGGNYDGLNYRKSTTDRYALLDRTLDAVIMTGNNLKQLKQEAIEWADYDDIVTQVLDQTTGQEIFSVDGAAGAMEYLDENCWKGYHREGNKELFGKTVPNCVKNEAAEGWNNPAGGVDWSRIRTRKDPRNPAQIDIYHGAKNIGFVTQHGPKEFRASPDYAAPDIDTMPRYPTLERAIRRVVEKAAKDGMLPTMHEGIEKQSCPECGGAMYPDTMITEKQDACYYKVKSRYKVWPSAYASGALVQCRKKGAANWGNKSKNESVENNMDELSRIVELGTGLSLEAKAELAEEFDLIESIIDDIAEHNGVDADAIWEDLESLSDDELYVFATTTTIMETEAWQKANKRDKTDGMSRKAVKTYRREHPGSKLQTAVTTKPSKLKKGSKASKRRKSYCSRSRGQMKMHNISCAKTPDKAICKARRRWNC